MTTYYPTLNEFWPAVRAKNFVKELGEKPGNYAKNMETLAAIARVHPKQMNRVNPVTFAERHFRKSFYPTANLTKILGGDTYSRLNDERNSPYIFGSATWAYHKKEPIPPYVEHVHTVPAVLEHVEEQERQPSAPVINEGFEEEIKTILDFMAKINSICPAAARYPVAIEMFNYIMTIEPFIRKFPKFYEACLKKVQEFKTQDISYALRDVLLKTEDFLVRLRKPEPAAPEPAAPKQEPKQEPEDSCCPYHVEHKTYRANNTDEYGKFLEIVKDYVGPDCWAIKVNEETLFDFYQDMSVKEYIQLSILHDKIADRPHILFVNMFNKRKDSTIMIEMYSNVDLVVKITYRAADETLTLLATSNPDRDPCF